MRWREREEFDECLKGQFSTVFVVRRAVEKGRAARKLQARNTSRLCVVKTMTVLKDKTKRIICAVM